MTKFISILFLYIGIILLSNINLGAQLKGFNNSFYYRNSISLIDTRTLVLASSQSGDGTVIATSPVRGRYPKMIRIDADSNKKENRIVNIWNKLEQYYLKVDTKDLESSIRISVYNMLGKEVLLIHDDKPKPKDDAYSFSGVSLPNGVYICVLQGRNFRDAEKFIVSR